MYKYVHTFKISPNYHLFYLFSFSAVVFYPFWLQTMGGSFYAQSRWWWCHWVQPSNWLWELKAEVHVSVNEMMDHTVMLNISQSHTHTPPSPQPEYPATFPWLRKTIKKCRNDRHLNLSLYLTGSYFGFPVVLANPENRVQLHSLKVFLCSKRLHGW